jgi:hypothetical protein
MSLSQTDLSSRENSLTALVGEMKKSSFIPTGTTPFIGSSMNLSDIQLPFAYGSQLLGQFIGGKGISPIPSPSAYNTQVNQTGKQRLAELIRFKSKEILTNIRKPESDRPPYPYESLYEHNHYAPDLNSTTWQAVSSLVKQSDEYIEARALFQNRLIRHINQKGGVLYDSQYREDDLKWKTDTSDKYPPNIDVWISQQFATSPGKQGNSFAADGPFFTVRGLSYSPTPPRYSKLSNNSESDDLDSEDRDLTLFFGEVERGLAYIKGLTYYNLDDGRIFYTANVEFYWFDGFNFDVNDPLTELVSYIKQGLEIQQYQWATPFTTSIRIDDVISGVMTPNTTTFADFTTTGNRVKQVIPTSATGVATNDTLLGTSDSDGLTGRSGNDRLVGGNGSDIFSGGKGADIFVLNGPNSGYDQILDFNGFEGDKIEISASLFGSSLTPFVALRADQLRIDAGATQATTISHRLIYDSTSGILWSDRDGIASQFVPVPIAGLSNKATISMSSFNVVA